MFRLGQVAEVDCWVSVLGQVRYKTWGQLNAAKDNVMVVCHALSGNASLDSWWGGLLGESSWVCAASSLVNTGLT